MVSVINKNLELGNIQKEQKANKVTMSNFENTLQKAFNDNDKKKLKEVCQDFESVFMGIIYKEMRATIQKSDLIPESNATKIFESMLDDEIVKKASKAGGIGLGDMLYNHMKQSWENQYVIGGKE